MSGNNFYHFYLATSTLFFEDISNSGADANLTNLKPLDLLPFQSLIEHEWFVKSKIEQLKMQTNHNKIQKMQRN